jgi:hypothetical protein
MFIPGRMKVEEPIMEDSSNLTGWWQKERARGFTKLECGLLGGLFTAIAIILMMVIRFGVG